MLIIPENEKMRCELEEWGYASEIKQILNKIKATPCEMQEKRQAVVARRAGKLGNEKMRELENGVNINNTNNARNTDN